LKKFFYDPSYVPIRFFEAGPGRERERAIEKFIFAGFAFFTSK
jgi:hypothetical protein